MQEKLGQERFSFGWAPAAPASGSSSCRESCQVGKLIEGPARPVARHASFDESLIELLDSLITSAREGGASPRSFGAVRLRRKP
jgi:hypothetical protein